MPVFKLCTLWHECSGVKYLVCENYQIKTRGIIKCYSDIKYCFGFSVVHLICAVEYIHRAKICQQQ